MILNIIGKENLKLQNLVSYKNGRSDCQSLGGEDMMGNKNGFSYFGDGLMHKGYLINCHTLIL